MKFSERLYELREDRFLTKTALATILNTSRQQITKYENNISTPTIDVLLKVADYFEVSADWLLGREDFHKDKKHNPLELPDELTTEDIDYIKITVNALRRERVKKSN